MSFTLPRTKALHEAIVAAGAESPYAEWLENWDPAHDISHRVTTRVPCGEYFAVRDAALIAHATQIDPEGRWFACPIDTQQQVWPTEDYELARSLVDSTVPESDLFAGLRSEAVVR
jgi:mycothiol S-conjugate amidase